MRIPLRFADSLNFKRVGKNCFHRTSTCHSLSNESKIASKYHIDEIFGGKHYIACK